MPPRGKHAPSRIRLSDDRRAALLASLHAYYAGTFDDALSDFRANGLLDFFIRELGPPVYNQGVRDATGFVQSKLADLEGEIYEPDDDSR
jgi:uncharacterized protein (DUF2164 family)